MKTIKLISIIIVLTIPVGSIAASHMWGVDVNLLSLKFPSFSSLTTTMDQSSKVTFWFNGMLSDTLKFEIDGGGGFDLGWNFTFDGDGRYSSATQDFSVYPILNKAYIHRKGTLLEYEIGRYMVSDPGNLILNTPLDGIEFTIKPGSQAFKAGVGYTGFLFNHSTSISMTANDLKRLEDKKALAAQRFIEYLSWTMPSTLWLQPELFFLAMQDVAADDDLSRSESERYHSMYLEFRSRGFLGQYFIYELALAGQLGFYGPATTVLAGSGKAKVSWLPNPKIQVGIEAILSTGDDSGRKSYEFAGVNEDTGTMLYQYLPVSSVSSRGYVLDFGLGNVISAAAYFKHSLSKGFNWELRTTTFLRPVEGGVVSTAMVNRDAEGSFIAQEALIGLSGNPNANFRWSVKVGALFYGDLIDLHSVFKQVLPVIPRVGFDLNFSL